MKAVLKLVRSGCLGLGICLAVSAHAGIEIFHGDDEAPVDNGTPEVTDPGTDLEEIVPETPPPVVRIRPRPSFDGGSSDHLALVISMQDYDHPPHDMLDSPTEDADAMALAFRQLGYRVMRVRDADRAGLGEALDRFADAIGAGDTIAVYYSGLGTALPFEKDNRLVPADFPAGFPEETDAAIDAVTKASLSLSGDVTSKILRRKPKALMVFHDACAADPLASEPVFQRYDNTVPCKPVILSNAATLYASGPGAPSMRQSGPDDISPLSVFPRAMLKALEDDPALSIDAMMRAVAAEVREIASSAGEHQSPVTRIALSQEVRDAGLCIAPRNGACTGEDEPDPETSPSSENPEEIAAWEACLKATERGPCESYLEQFPEGPNVRAAERRRIEVAAQAVTMDVEEYVPFSGSSGSTNGTKKVDVEALIRACDEFAAHPSNDENPEGIKGVSYRGIDETKALPACLDAVKHAPDNLRVRYQLARAKQAAGQGKEAIADFLELATEHAYVPAINNLGSVYQLGLGVEKDDAEAARWYGISADKGFVPSMSILGWMYQSGRGVPKDNDKAFELYSKAAAGGSASAMHNLGFMYQNGWGTKPDGVVAAEWFEKAAQQEFPQAMAMTGWLYQTGRGVDKDIGKAFHWYRKAADKNLPSAMGAVAGIYDSGDGGVDRSPEEAARWFVKALRGKHRSTRTRLLDKPTSLREDTRKAIQTELARLGYDPGPADGAFGGKTRDAIEAAFTGK